MKRKAGQLEKVSASAQTAAESKWKKNQLTALAINVAVKNQQHNQQHNKQQQRKQQLTTNKYMPQRQTKPDLYRATPGT
jgi:zona occludens toxin (predicted ATPase)